MTQRVFSLSLFSALSLFLAACSTGPRIGQDVDLHGNFAQYQTFRIVHPHPSLSLRGLNSADTLAHAQALTEAISLSLESKGYQIAETGKRPDIYIAFTLGDRAEIDLYKSYATYSETDWLWSSDPSARQYNAQAVALDVFDGQTGNAVWHAYANLKPPRNAEEAAALMDYQTAVAAALVNRLPRRLKVTTRKKRGFVFIY